MSLKSYIAFGIIAAFMLFINIYMVNMVNCSDDFEERIIKDPRKEFCSGWSDGFVAGYCLGFEGECEVPIIPDCPHTLIWKSKYMDGYDSGFVKGLYSKSRRKVLYGR